MSFAVKMSPSKAIADRKSTSMDTEVFYEALETLQGDEAEKLINIIKDIEDGKMDQDTMEQLVHEYEEKLH